MSLPKKHIENMRLHKTVIGNERRRESIKNIIDKSVNFSKGVMLKDIDQAFTEWVEKELYIVFDGEVMPTFKLFSNQRISEYAQNWSHTDSMGNILLNFKTISRENNPKKGNNQGGAFNIPGERDYIVGYVPVLQENGQEAYDMYTMKQPYTLDLTYTVTMVTNKYELINNMNQLVHNKFSALQAYIFPNGHAMPMKLSDVSDESEYSIDDRKYYSQSYKIELLAYIIDPSGFKVTHIPSRLKIRTSSMDKKNKHKDDVKIKIEEWNKVDECAEPMPSPYINQSVNIVIEFPLCKKEVDFTIDTDLVVDTLELKNIYDFIVCINGEKQDFDSDYEIKIYNGDDIHIEISRENLYSDSLMEIKCYNPNVVYDERDNPESSLDDNKEDIEIII